MRSSHIGRYLAFFSLLLSLGLGTGRAYAEGQRPKFYVRDSLSIRNLPQELGEGRRKMATSQAPIQMQVTGSSICIRSNSAQLLPIYDSKKDFYMAMYLNKGINWLNGLPRGKYYINNRQVTIN